jgi:hypothetical protein
MQSLFTTIIDKCDPDEVVDILGLDTKDLVRAFASRIELQPELFEHLITDYDPIELFEEMGDDDEPWAEYGDE